MVTQPCIGVDLMGGDVPPISLFSAVEQAVFRLPPQITFVVLATPEVISALPPPTLRIRYEAAEQVIAMDDAPLTAIRTKRNATMVRGIQLLSEKQIQAFVSVGNTGALVACATLTLPLISGVDRPALLATLPTLQGTVAVLDIGGLVSATADQLVLFAKLGADYQRRRKRVPRPRVGILNIGSESLKGTSEHRAAYAKLQEFQGTDFVFAGNVEGRDVFEGVVDVLVTDGFTGNVFLKTAEGVSAFMLKSLHESFGGTEAFEKLHRHVDYAQYSGALLCGMDPIVIKCHGCSSPEALFHGILGAYELIDCS